MIKNKKIYTCINNIYNCQDKKGIYNEMFCVNFLNQRIDNINIKNTSSGLIFFD